MSLKRIVLRDFVIVSELDLDLASGFTVLTGETGAGKSIILSALALLTGGRASSETLRSGADEGVVEALFRMDGHEDVAAALIDRGLAEDALDRDNFMTAEQAKTWGLIDEIVQHRTKNEDKE